jgi:DUF177 domain-containing protein
MKIRLDRVVDEPFEWQETLEFTRGELDRQEVVDLGKVECQGRVSPLAEGYLFEASLSHRATFRCMRCLDDFERPVSSEVSLLIEVRRQNETIAEEIELEEADLGVLVLEQPELETRPILTEQLHLDIPMKPLCREDCAGLCAGCGTNLNTGSCSCKAESDPRWRALEELKLH